MTIFNKKEIMTDRQKKINDLKEEIHNCEKMMRRAEAIFDMTVDENLIEARIYEMKSLAKHHDYLIKTLRELMYTDTDMPVTVRI